LESEQTLEGTVWHQDFEDGANASSAAARPIIITYTRIVRETIFE
jgi:hypothetical protein